MTEPNQPTRRDIALALTTRRIGRPLWHYTSVLSTMPLAHELAREGAGDGTAIMADEQTAGRGRRGRAWVAPPSTAILCSVLCRPPVPPERLFLLTAAFGLGLCAGIERAAGIQPSVKWPNDLLLGGRKLAGILCESRLGARGLDHAVVGFGLNVNLLADDLPPPQPGALSPTSLALAIGAPVERDVILRAVLGGIDDAYDRLWAGDEAGVRADWVTRLAGVGEEVRIETDAGARTGIFAGVAADGALILRTGGQTEHYLVGDVVIGPRPLMGDLSNGQ